ncbi:aminoacyl-tRNA hydrolase [Radiobacillus deserti]|uniref:Peptidyl-tRNA hydrolase n=1 Tax=Radiobacillus deserti TaxID=2594883 RepID=A0A516KBT7_9BACI|nr:aminoacyl-tRNA hydrolase [Radiobacillus deserti]QDP38827.1 aminoacyl-tRNA hydrolase [Radiobacillus deserti]
MKCIVGLGNPGRRFEDTRHNIGFMVVDELMKRHQLSLDKKKFNGQFTTHVVEGEKVIFLQPLTYMNLSGESVRPLADFYNLNPEDIVVIYDDLDLPNGKIRLRQKGGHGGHNGIRSMIDHLGTKEFKRIRVGIGRPTTPQPVPNFVTEPFTKEEWVLAREGIYKAADACDAWFSKPFEQVMNEFN